MQDSDANRLVKALGEADYRSTRLASTGGFLKSGNTTIMVGCEEDEVGGALDVIKGTCSERIEKSASSYPMRANTDFFSMGKVEIGGATVFVLPVESFYRF